jgi:periplasmic divalent cation tolerance protein
MNDPTPTVPPFGVVLTTLPDEAGAEALARQIVDAGLGACVQLQPIRSVYRWKGETCVEPEWRLVIKTRADRYPALEAFIRARHPYTLPQIVMLPITAGAPDYLQWVADGSAGAE